jgi:hypothetical protein
MDMCVYLFGLGLRQRILLKWMGESLRVGSVKYS